jgi:hypothetical protein
MHSVHKERKKKQKRKKATTTAKYSVRSFAALNTYKGQRRAALGQRLKNLSPSHRARGEGCGEGRELRKRERNSRFVAHNCLYRDRVNDYGIQNSVGPGGQIEKTL